MWNDDHGRPVRAGSSRAEGGRFGGGTRAATCGGVLRVDCANPRLAGPGGRRPSERPRESPCPKHGRSGWSVNGRIFRGRRAPSSGRAQGSTQVRFTMSPACRPLSRANGAGLGRHRGPLRGERRGQLKSALPCALLVLVFDRARTRVRASLPRAGGGRADSGLLRPVPCL